MPLIEPTGHWSKSAHHRIAWALNQVLAKRRDDQKRRAIAAWEWRLSRALLKALKRVDWDAWARKHLRVVQQEAKKCLRPIRERVAKDLEITPGVDFDEDLPELDLAEVETMVGKMYREAGKQAWMLGSPASVVLSFPEAEFDASMAEAFKKVRGVSDTVRDRMRSVMRETMEDSQTFREFGIKLTGYFPDISRKRANAIAVTEYNNAASMATQLLMEKQGQLTKQSNSVGDEKVCEECLANEGQGPIPVRDNFQSGHKCPAYHPG